VMLSQTYADLAREPEGGPFNDKRYLETVSGIIHEVAASGRVVILGRGSQMILHDHAEVLNVLCVARPDVRWKRTAEREDVSPEKAKKLAAEHDSARAAFHRRFWKVDVENPTLYDLTIDTSRLSYDAAAEIAAEAARLKATATG
jgi:cytidylate kinase